MATSSASPVNGRVSYAEMAVVLSNAVRWRVLAQLFKEDLLDVTELARRVGQNRSNLSKQLAVLRKHGVVEQWRAKLYRIPAKFRVAGEAILDFGSVILRMDEVK